MRFRKAILIRTVGAVCALLLLVPFSFGASKQSKQRPKSASSKSVSGKSTTASKSRQASHSSAKTTHGRKNRKTVRKAKGQQAIDPDRAREIQAALIRERYLDGDPTGVWDAQTKAALAKFQGDNGWQTKVLPDSRALIKLGLGPSREGLLNPESAAIGSAHELGAEKVIPGGSVPHK